jgi:hypothetical protein
MVTDDFAGRALAVAVRALPADRRDWGLAMQAELATVEDAAARRSFAFGCTRTLLTRPATLLRLARAAFAPAVGAVSVALALAIPSAGVRAEALALIAVLAGALWLGRRPGLLGPVAADRTSQRVRAASCAVVGVLLMTVLLPSSGGGHDDPSGAWVVGLVVLLYLAAALFATARGTAAGARTLRLATGVVAAGAAASWVPMLLSAGVRAHPEANLAVVTATVLAGGVLALYRRLPAPAAIVAGLGTGAATCLLITLLALGTYAARPELVPDRCGTSNACGLTPAARAETNAILAGDPYVADLLLGSLLAALLLATAGAGLALAGEPGRRRSA